MITPPPPLECTTGHKADQLESVTISRGFSDVVKILAAIFVAMGHYSSHASYYVNNPFVQFIAAFCPYVGVAIFFFLSGYGLMKSEQKRHLPFFAFLKRRMLKVYYPVVFVSLLWAIVKWPQGEGLRYIPELLLTTFVTFGDGVLWFVQVLFFLYLFFWVYSAVARYKSFLSLLLLLLGTVVCYAVVFFLWGDWCAISIPMFTIGILVAKYSNLFYRLSRSWAVLLWLAVITGAMILLYFMYGNLYLHALSCYYVITGIIVLCAFRRIIISPPLWLNDFSFDIYLTHHKLMLLLIPLNTLIFLHHFIIGTILLSAASFTLRKGLYICMINFHKSFSQRLTVQ